MQAGGGWRANDRVANASRVPTKDSVKTEDPKDVASTPLPALEAPIGLAPLGPPTTKPADGGRAGAPRHLLFLQSDRAVDARLEVSLGEFACPAELRSTRISDSNSIESDLFSVSCGYADWRRACASFDRADSSLLEVEQGDLERADQALGDPKPHATASAAKPPPLWPCPPVLSALSCPVCPACLNTC